MASIGTKLKKLPFKRKAYLFGIISFFAFVLFFGIQAVYAYYHNTLPLSILATLIGDFDSGDGDVNMMIYKETGKNTNVFTRSYVTPYVGYEFNDSLTTCLKPCENDDTKNCEIKCGTDSSSSCYYAYDESTMNFSLTSTHKVTCKFYFNAAYDSDFNVYIMKEDTEGTESYNSKNYSIIENVPAYGYKYVGYTCSNTVESFTYNSDTKTFNVSTSTQNTCYAYFDQVGNADIVTNVYVQEYAGSTVYEEVDSIPANKIYVLSESQNSYCYDSSGVDTGATITYTDGYINITADGQQTCDVYLDVSSD